MALPTAEFCCRLGFEFLQNNEINNSIFWYGLATQLDIPKTKDEILHEDVLDLVTSYSIMCLLL